MENSLPLLVIGSHKFKHLRDEVESILMSSGQFDPAELSPYFEKDNQGQLNMLDPKQNAMPNKVIETEAPKNDMITVNLNTQDTQLNPKPNPMPKKTMTPRHKFKRIKKGGKVQKIQSSGIHKIKFKNPHRDKRIYWSKQLCYVNKLSYDSNSFALQNLCYMVKSNINGLHTVIYPQSMWLLERPRVKIK